MHISSDVFDTVLNTKGNFLVGECFTYSTSIVGINFPFGRLNIFYCAL